MKNLLTVLVCCVSLNLCAQESEKIAVQKTIESFFEGFHNQDSLQIKATVSETIIMQTISNDEAGKSSVKTQDFSEFLRAITGIPKTTEFREVIKSYAIQIDGPMANAWTPYEFQLNNAFHHCGVNSFQLFKDNLEGWQIIYLIDTRRKSECDL